MELPPRCEQAGSHLSSGVQGAEELFRPQGGAWNMLEGDGGRCTRSSSAFVSSSAAWMSCEGWRGMAGGVQSGGWLVSVSAGLLFSLTSGAAGCCEDDKVGMRKATGEHHALHTRGGIGGEL